MSVKSLVLPGLVVSIRTCLAVIVGTLVPKNRRGTKTMTSNVVSGLGYGNETCLSGTV